MLLLLLLLVAAAAEIQEPRAKHLKSQEPLLHHYSPERKTSPLRRERVSQEGEVESTRVLKMSYSNTLFQKKAQQLSVLSSLVFLSSYLEEDCSTRISQMIFELLSVLYSV